MTATRSFIVFLLTIVSVAPLKAQSVYHLQYRFGPPGDTTRYQAFLARFDDGSGLLRVRYTTPATREDVVVEMETGESFVTDTVTGKTDTSTLFLQAGRPRVIIGNDKLNILLPRFRFGLNTGSGFYEPAGADYTSGSSMVLRATDFSAALMAGAALSKPFVAAFFSPDEDFYSNLFKTGSRGLNPAEKNTRMYLLVVADTLDETIGGSCGIDMRRALQTFKSVADTMGISFTAKTIAGAGYSKANVQEAVTALKPHTADIVVFYYTGHGFRKKEEQRRFPNIKLKTHHTSRQDVINNSLNIEDIFNQIKKKGARLNLVLSDCCNDDIETTNISGTQPGKTKSSGVNWDQDNCRRLFLNPSPMSILATAADNGQRASSKNDFGGFFSWFFQTSMENYCSKLKSNVSWDQVLQDAKTQTIYKAQHTYCDKPYVPANICNQYPYYIIR